MAKKVKKLSDSTRIAFKALRGKGLIPKEWRVSDLTDYKIKKVRAIAKQYDQLIRTPDNFTARSVSKDTANALKSAGYKVHEVSKGKFRAILPSKGIEKQSIRDGKLVIHRKRRVETVYLAGGIELLESLAERMNGEILKPDEYWTLKMGDKMTFMEMQFESVEDCIDYYYTVEKYLSEAVKQNLQLVKVKLLD